MQRLGGDGSLVIADCHNWAAPANNRDCRQYAGAVQIFPAILADCTEPLPPEADDIRGLARCCRR